MRYLAFLVLLMAGCSSDYTARCKKIIEHTIEIGLRESTEGMTGEEKQKFVDRIESRRSEAMDKCEEAEPSQANEDCALRGQSMAQINSCTWFSEAKMAGAR